MKKASLFILIIYVSLSLFACKTEKTGEFDGKLFYVEVDSQILGDDFSGFIDSEKLENSIHYCSNNVNKSEKDSRTVEFMGEEYEFDSYETVYGYGMDKPLRMYANEKCQMYFDENGNLNDVTIFVGNSALNDEELENELESEILIGKTDELFKKYVENVEEYDGPFCNSETWSYGGGSPGTFLRKYIVKYNLKYPAADKRASFTVIYNKNGEVMEVSMPFTDIILKCKEDNIEIDYERINSEITRACTPVLEEISADYRRVEGMQITDQNVGYGFLENKKYIMLFSTVKIDYTYIYPDEFLEKEYVFEKEEARKQVFEFAYVLEEVSG